ncbi:hypothetical protein [Gallibacterium sp. AGMB14963]|uniref:hypothetical protein n=1 Tax=Gallibacterium faecale TaxID=3019086 RepID=UPI0022F1961E|nr:hypothetical protein [Gallibacterium sp. AGMB14963]MDA3979555.1 hypothetical protein [Gallibacterium sp. AGMB14963]
MNKLKIAEEILLKFGARKSYEMTKNCTGFLKGKESFVLSLYEEELMLSVGFVGLKANLKKAEKIANKIFGKHFSVRHMKENRMDGIRASYFQLELLN